MAIPSPLAASRPATRRLYNAGINVIMGEEKKRNVTKNPLAEYYRRPTIIQKDKENVVGVTPLPKVTSEKIMQMYYSPAIEKPSNKLMAQVANAVSNNKQRIRPSWWG